MIPTTNLYWRGLTNDHTPSTRGSSVLYRLPATDKIRWCVVIVVAQRMGWKEGPAGTGCGRTRPWHGQLCIDCPQVSPAPPHQFYGAFWFCPPANNRRRQRCGHRGWIVTFVTPSCCPGSSDIWDEKLGFGIVKSSGNDTELWRESPMLYSLVLQGQRNTIIVWRGIIELHLPTIIKLLKCHDVQI